MRLCSYTVPHDCGFAPNPFWGYCTLAACTPNHQGVKVQAGDWIAGFEPVDRGGKLVYVMKVSETMSFDAFFHDRRFQRKKPRLEGTWRQRCGDNIYHRSEEGWKQLPSPFHSAPEKAKDIKYPSVFIAEEFYYFGEKAVPVPSYLDSLRFKRQGCKCSHPPSLVESFLDWLRTTHRPGIHGRPRDREGKDGCGSLCKTRSKDSPSHSRC